MKQGNSSSYCMESYSKKNLIFKRRREIKKLKFRDALWSQDPWYNLKQKQVLEELSQISSTFEKKEQLTFQFYDPYNFEESLSTPNFNWFLIPWLLLDGWSTCSISLFLIPVSTEYYLHIYKVFQFILQSCITIKKLQIPSCNEERTPPFIILLRPCTLLLSAKDFQLAFLVNKKGIEKSLRNGAAF